MNETFRFIVCWGENGNGKQLHLVYTFGALDEIVICDSGGLCSKIAHIEYVMDVNNFLEVEGYREKMINNTLTQDDIKKIIEYIMLTWLVKAYMKYYAEDPGRFLTEWEQEKKYIEEQLQSKFKWKTIMENCD